MPLYLVILWVYCVSTAEFFIARFLPPTKVGERKFHKQGCQSDQSSNILNPQTAKGSLSLAFFLLILLGNQRPIYQLVSNAVVIHAFRNSSKVIIHVINIPTLLPVDLVYRPECFCLAFSLMGFVYSLPQFRLQSVKRWFDNLKAFRRSLPSYKFCHLYRCFY